MLTLKEFTQKLPKKNSLGQWTSKETFTKTTLPNNIYFYKVKRYNQGSDDAEFYAKLMLIGL